MRGFEIGIAGPFSGPRRAYGELLRAHAEAAAGEAKLVFADDAADPDTAERAAAELIERGVSAVIGHFNSDCARIAGPSYRRAEIAFLMPAATAWDLCAATGGYRVCASDNDQIEAMGDWLAARGQTIRDIWTDGSRYGETLAEMVEAHGLLRGTATRSAGPVALFGSHVQVAREMRRRGDPRDTYLLPDDCAIDDFDRLLAGSELDYVVPHPSPDFGACVEIAVAAALEAARKGRAPIDDLPRSRRFRDRQYVDAGFRMERRKAPAAPLEGVAR